MYCCLHPQSMFKILLFMLSLPSIFFGRTSLSEAPWSGVPSEFRCSFPCRRTVAYHLQQYCNEPVNVFLNNWFTQEESSRVKSNVTISFSTDSIDPCGIKDRNMGMVTQEDLVQSLKKNRWDDDTLLIDMIWHITLWSKIFLKSHTPSRPQP